MQAKFLFTDEAAAMLEETAMYIADQCQSVGTALRFVDRDHEVCHLLAQNPNAGVWRPELGAGIRSLPIGKYTIFYRPNDDHIWIVLVIHSARDIPSFFRSFMK